MKKVLFPILALVLALSLALPVTTVGAAVTGTGTDGPTIPGGRTYLGDNSELKIDARPVIVTDLTGVNLTIHQYESDTEIRVFNEKQYYTLTSALDIDEGFGDFAGDSSIPVDYVINIHLIHQEPTPNDASDPIRGVGSIEFDGDIIAVIVEDELLDASDYLGHDDIVAYPTGLNLRGLETYDQTPWQDLYEVSGNVLKVDLQSAEVMDHIRVITEPVFDGFVTGGGNIKNSNKSAWTFGGNVGVTQSGQIVGQFQINDHNGKESWHGHNAFTSLVLSGSPTWSPPASFDVATFEGTYTSNKGNTKYLKVEIWDDQEPGKDYDWITVWESDDAGITWTIWFVGNPISSGNFQLHDGFKD